MLAQLGYDVLPYVVTIVVAFLGFVARHVEPYLKAKIGEKNLSNIEKKLGIAEQQIKQKKGIAYDAVRFAEDAFKNLGGADKLSKAVDWALKEALTLGLNVSKPQLEDAIRIAYTELKPQLSYGFSSLLNAPTNEKSEDVAPDEATKQAETTPEPVQEVEKPLTEMTSTDIRNIVSQAVKEQLQERAPVQPVAQPQ
jgi:hypothetical protein